MVRGKELSKRELEVTLLLYKKGLRNIEMAEYLGIGETTVKFHLTNAFKKLGVSTREQLIRKVHSFFEPKHDGSLTPGRVNERINPFDERALSANKGNAGK